MPRDAYSWLPMAGKMASVRSSGAGDLEEAFPVALVAAAVDEVAGEDGEIGLLVGERLIERGVDVVAGAHVAVDGEAQRAAGVGRRVEGGVAGVELAAPPPAPCARDAIVVDGAGLEAVEAQRRGACCAAASRASLPYSSSRPQRTSAAVGKSVSKTIGHLALAEADEIGAAHEARAFVAAQRQLDGGVAAGGARMDLDGEHVVAARERRARRR